MSKSEVDLRDYVLAILNYANGKIEGKVRLQKILFILKYDDKLPVPLKYVPHMYGPYSMELVTLLKQMRKEELVFENHVNKSTYDNADSDYRADLNLTNKGYIESENSLKKFSLRDQERIKSESSYWSRRPILELLVYIYASFPDFAKNSRIKEKIMPSNH